MPGDIAKEIDALQQMTTSELADRYEELYGQPVRTRGVVSSDETLDWPRSSLIRSVTFAQLGENPVQ